MFYPAGKVALALVFFGVALVVSIATYPNAQWDTAITMTLGFGILLVLIGSLILCVRSIHS